MSQQQGGGEQEIARVNVAETNETLSQPWYRSPSDPHPFALVKKISSNIPDAPTYRTISCFPWDEDSLSTLWQGSLAVEENFKNWKETVSKYWDAVAVGSEHRVYIFFTDKKINPICIDLPKDSQEILIGADVVCVAWALSHHALTEPMVIFSRGSLLYIYNVERSGMASYLRGHGGAITSISVHPTTAHLFCTTSRDNSTRIYDLTLPPQQYPQNPHWPPGKKPSMAGAAHGLHLTEAEGSGIGRCIIVLMGGRSGGHQAAVLGAAFHPHLPLIATCGMDRNVKIWAIRPTSIELITREDKPLFSSGRIHKARVLSVTWLQHDLLLTHSAAAIMRVDPADLDNKVTELEPGELIIWRWLGVNRFFPPDKDLLRQTVLRGCASDYQESSSFKLISTYTYASVPNQYITPQVHVYQSPTHDPLILSAFPNSSSFLITNAANLRPRSRPLFPIALTKPPNPVGDGSRKESNTTGTALVDETERMRLAWGAGSVGHGIGGMLPPDDQVLPGAISRDGPPQISGWEVGMDTPHLQNIAMTCRGCIIIGVGSRGTVWVWRIKGAQTEDVVHDRVG